MTGQSIQDKLNLIISDLHTDFAGQGVNLMFRDVTNTPVVFVITANEIGEVNAAQVAAVQAFVDNLVNAADDLELFSIPIRAAQIAFNAAQLPHSALIESARLARVALQTALDGDANYQQAKGDLDDAKTVEYEQALVDYKNNNVPENAAELSNARGNYFPFVDGPGGGQ